MASPSPLHPKIRERLTPRVSASALAEYILAEADRLDKILHDARFQSPYVSPKYGEAIRTIQAFCTDDHRSPRTLADSISALNAKANDTSHSPSQRDEARRCIEAIDLFDKGQNAFGARTIAAQLGPDRFSFELNGVEVSCVPPLFATDHKGRRASVFVRAPKTPDPDACKTDDTRAKRTNYRRELARYLLVIGRLAMIAQGHKPADLATKEFAVWDLRLGEAIPFPSDRVTRERRIEAACGHITRLWDTIEPNTSDRKTA